LIGKDAELIQKETGIGDPVQALFSALEKPLAHRQILARPLGRLALAYLTQARHQGRLYDSVAAFHLANGARLERINAFGNLRPYGLRASYGVTVNYRYLPEELEENHEMFVQKGQICVSSGLAREQKEVAADWVGDSGRDAKRRKREVSALNSAK
jgi:malonyl-CoA decarboxylase